MKGSSGTLEIAILPQFLTLEPRFVREGFIRTSWNRNFTSVFDTRTSFCAWRVLPARLKSQFYLSFWHSNLVSCVKGSSGTLEIAILPQFWTLEPRFVRKGCNRQLKVAILPQFLTLEPRFVREGFIRTSWNRNFTSVFDSRTSFRGEGSSGTLEIAILPQFWTLEPRFVRKGCNRQLKVAILPQFLTLEPRFVREGFIRTSWNRNFTSVFDTRTSFCAWRVHPARLKSQFYLSFWHSNLVSCVKGSSGQVEIAILPQFLTLEPRFVREGWRFVIRRRHCPRPKERKKKKERVKRERETECVCKHLCVKASVCKSVCV